MKIAFSVNGEQRTVDVPPIRRLLDVLREDLRLTGSKEGCGEGECGACTVLIGGKPIDSCLVPVYQVAGEDVITIEGVADEAHLHPIQRCFLEHGGAQCGICTPGMVLSAKALLDDNPSPSEDEMRVAIAGNLCRCTGYEKILQSIEIAAAELRGDA